MDQNFLSKTSFFFAGLVQIVTSVSCSEILGGLLLIAVIGLILDYPD